MRFLVIFFADSLAPSFLQTLESCLKRNKLICTSESESKDQIGLPLHLNEPVSVALLNDHLTVFAEDLVSQLGPVPWLLRLLRGPAAQPDSCQR